MSSSEEEDYMSDKFATENIKDVRPGLVFSQKRKREMEVLAKKAKLDDEARQKPSKLNQQERLQEGLQNAIPSSNIGFALLSKMGYKKGESIGKSNQGIKEPISITVKSDRQGLGREAAIKQIKERKKSIMMERLKRKEGAAEFDPEEYRRRMGRNSELKQIESDLARCQRACERLDLEEHFETPAITWFWPNKEVKKDDEETESDEEQEETVEEYEPHEKLEMVNNYLRTTHLFCHWCGVKFEDLDDMAQNCPGDTKADH